MKNTSLCLLTFALAVQQLSAQPSDSNRAFVVKSGDDSDAPLYLFTSGAGGIFPFENGQTLKVGRRYFMIAIPDQGSVFENWQPVHVFTTIVIVTNNVGEATFITNTVASPTSEYISRPVMAFTMQPETVVVDSPLIKINVREGWQANFASRNNHFQR